MLRSRQYRQRIAFKKTIEDALYIDAPANMRQLFAEMATKTGAPTFLSVLSPATLDKMYEEYAPEKWLSKTGSVIYSINGSDELVHAGSLSDLADILIATYGLNWNKIWTAYNKTYEPLENYNMYQKATYNSSEEHNGKDTLTKSGTEANTKTGTETTEYSGKEINEKLGKEINEKSGSEINEKSGTETKTQGGSETNVRSGSEELAKAGSESTNYNSNTESLVSAFNSADYQDANKSIKGGADAVTFGVNELGTANARTDTTTYNDVTDEKTFDQRTDELSFDQRKDELSFDQRKDELSFDQRKDQMSFDQRKDELSFNQRKDELSFNQRADETSYDSALDHTGYDELERSGNIGVTTSQQMLQSEIDLRQYNFIMAVFRDVTDMLGLPIY